MSTKAKRSWARIVGFFALIFGAILGGWMLSRYATRQSVHGPVKSPTPFVRDPHNERRIQVWTGDKGFKAVDLPAYVKAKDVRAVEYKEGINEDVHVEVKSKNRVDRRAPASRAGASS